MYQVELSSSRAMYDVSFQAQSYFSSVFTCSRLNIFSRNVSKLKLHSKKSPKPWYCSPNVSVEDIFFTDCWKKTKDKTHQGKTQEKTGLPLQQLSWHTSTKFIKQKQDPFIPKYFPFNRTFVKSTVKSKCCKIVHEWSRDILHKTKS